MKLREIKQHHLPAIFSIIILILSDSFSCISTYYIIKNVSMIHMDFSFPWHFYIAIIFIIYLFRNYNPSPLISREKEIKIIIKSIYISGIIYIVAEILLMDSVVEQSQFTLFFLHLFLLISIPLRLFIRSVQRLLLSKGIGGRYTILLGAGKEAQGLANTIIQNPIFGFDLRGYYNVSESKEMNQYCSYLGNMNQIDSYIQNHNIHEMIIALDDHEHNNLLNIIGRFGMLNVCIKIIPDMYEAISGQVRIDILNGITLMDINPDIMTEFQSIMKRVIDMILSFIILTLLLPLILILMIIISLNSPGGVFYKQVRLGKSSIRFNLYKFRTMYINSEDATGPIWAEKNDPRITSVGKVLRKFHLDEIPQLYNVFMGKMSIVGPRPERPRIINNLIENIPYYIHRMKVKPGITGWAQIRGTYDTSLQDVYVKLKNDFYYIENISLFLDFKIILLTVWTIIKAKGH